jgi:hypothetical protein
MLSLDDPRWKDLQHAYGDAADVLRALVSRRAIRMSHGSASGRACATKAIVTLENLHTPTTLHALVLHQKNREDAQNSNFWRVCLTFRAPEMPTTASDAPSAARCPRGHTWRA